MIGPDKVAKYLVESGAYRELDKPVILTSGQLGIFYVNTGNLLDDGGVWQKYGDNPEGMIGHAVKIVQANWRFKEVIDLLSERVGGLLPDEKRLAISGGQRKDWIFSGPVARELGLPHISLFKENKIPEVIMHDGKVESVKILDYDVVHVVDLLTEGSSCYSDGSPPKGWVPALRERGARISDLVSVVTRKQGGEERLGNVGVDVHSIVSVDEDFVREHSANPKRAIEIINYMGDPDAWSKRYLEKNGVLAFVDDFSPNGDRVERALKFVRRYGESLRAAGRFDELEIAVFDRFGYSLATELNGGE